MVSEAERKHALECLRFQADCMQLAGDSRSPKWQSHFLMMSRVWSDLSELAPGASTIKAQSNS